MRFMEDYKGGRDGRDYWRREVMRNGVPRGDNEHGGNGETKNSKIKAR